ncbi:MAG: YbjN domain-containing protein [Gemmataceae bacterium]|nr:YbjN domain-containing protein [Gemmataceae bacterium]MCS7269779.1 YbjN domain-containing protein [Gemmataceae bacterium]MDW8241954.1 YbjN domain-containing protein [Thermogemmata sp.]
MNNNDLITSDTLNNNTLRELFDAAMFDYHLDDDGDLVIRDQFRVLVTHHNNRYVRFTSFFRVRPDASSDLVHNLCNRINDELIVLRASIHQEETLVVDWYIPVFSGISKRTVVMAFRKFVELLGQIGQYDEDDVIE